MLLINEQDCNIMDNKVNNKKTNAFSFFIHFSIC